MLIIHGYSAIEFITVILFAHISDVKGTNDRRHERNDECNANKRVSSAQHSKERLYNGG